MTKRAKGFIPPEHANIPDDVCMLVFVPNDPHAIAAFWGQFEDLGLWTTWARTGDTRARDIAERFKTSIIESLDLHDEVGCMSPLTINVNCGSQSNCSQLIQFDLNLDIHIGAEDLADIVALPGGNTDNGYLPPAQETYSEYLTLKCAYANQMATDIYNSWDNLASLGLSAGAIGLQAFGVMLSTGSFVSALTGIIGGIVTTGTLGTVALGAFVGLGALFGIAAYGYFEQLQAAMSIDDLRCALYGATSAEDARRRVADTFYEFGVTAGLVPIAQGELVDAFVYLAKTLTPVTILEPLFDATPYTLALPVADCTLCTPVPPQLPDTSDAELTAYILFNQNLYEEDQVSGLQLLKTGTIDLVGGLWGNQAIQINANGEYFRAATPGNAMDLPAGDYTMVAWIAPQEMAASSGTIAVKANNSSNKTWHLDIRTSPVLHFFWSHAYSPNQFVGVGGVSYGDLELDMWHFVCVRYNAATSTMSFRTNGPAYVDNNYAVQVPRQSTEPVDVGGWVNYPSFGARFAIQEFAILDGMLTDDEVDFLFNSGLGRPVTSLFPLP